MKTTPSTLVAIVGGSGCGKTWLAERLQRVLGEKAGRLSLDDFYKDRSQMRPSLRDRINFDNPSAIDWPLVESVLQDCRAGRPTRLPRYDFSSHTRRPTMLPWRPRPLVLMDGLWLLRRPAVRRMFALKLFIRCPRHMRLRRRLERDAFERGRSRASILRQFRETVHPMHLRYVEPQSTRADVVLNQPIAPAEAERLVTCLWHLLKTGSLLPAWMRETFRAEVFALVGMKGN